MNRLLLALLILVFSVEPGYSYTVPDTGQTQSYTTTFGEDSDYTINPPSYTDLGNGIVRDNVTGLEWVQDGNLMATRDPEFDNDDTAGDGAVTWQHALDYVVKLNNEYYLGHNDWRLPTVNELSFLVDSDRYSPSIDTTFFLGTVASWYWSSTPYNYNSDYAWFVSFKNGTVYYYPKSGYYYYVRAVRSGQAVFNAFVDNGDGTVTDISTGLMWQQATSWFLWEQALNYCESLILNNDGQWTNNIANASGAKYSDWRLPNRNELQTLVDYSRDSPSIDTTFFPDTGAFSYYWSSTTFASATGIAWFVSFYYGGVNHDFGKTYGYYVRAVRSVGPTAIYLSSFSATPQSGKIIMQWNTESETDNAGFNIYRSESAGGEYTKINETLIPAQGSPTRSASYEFVDKDVKLWRTYYYRLEDIDLSGTSTMHGPVSATPRLINVRREAKKS